jgi:hypothetical protein
MSDILFELFSDITTVENKQQPIQFQNCVKKFNSIILNELKENNIKCWIAGGSVRDYFQSIPINTDIDIFFPNETEMNKCLEYFKKSEISEILWESEHGCKIKYKKHTFDIIKHYFNSPIDSIENFDFTVSMFAVDNDYVYHGETSFIDLSKKQIMINKITYPPSTMKRIIKYTKKGFYICDGELKKAIIAIENTPKEKQINESIPVSVKDNTTTVQDNKEETSFTDIFFIGID